MSNCILRHNFKFSHVNLKFIINKGTKQRMKESIIKYEHNKPIKPSCIIIQLQLMPALKGILSATIVIILTKKTQNYRYLNYCLG
jgi:hypothetical protein